MYIPPKVTWKSYIWVFIQTPNFFAHIRFYKIWSFKNNVNKYRWFNYVLNMCVFILGLPINMVRVVKFWYTMVLILTFDFENFEAHYMELHSKYI